MNVVQRTRGTNDPQAYEKGEAIPPGKRGKVGMLDDPDTLDERLQDGIEVRAWMPSGAGESLDDYSRVRNIPGLNSSRTTKRLAELGVSRRDVLISARGRYYWVNGRETCPFDTGPNGEIHPRTFEKVQGLQ